MKIHISGLGEIEAEDVVIRQLKNMALHSAEDCYRMAEVNRERGCMYQYEYWNKLFDMYLAMRDSIEEVIG